MTSISYELAAKLKEAGFPQGAWKPGEQYWSPGKGTKDGQPFVWQLPMWGDLSKPVTFHSEVREQCGLVYTPTLSELIAACGKKFQILEFCCDDHGWYAFRQLGKEEGSRGTTPEKAVANLWLALNAQTDNA